MISAFVATLKYLPVLHHNAVSIFGSFRINVILGCFENTELIKDLLDSVRSVAFM